MRIMTFNIRFDNQADEDNSWPYRKEIVKAIIEKYSPDVLGTQEGRRPQLEELNSMLSELDLVDIHRPWIQERMYPCFYCQEKGLESGDIWLSENPQVPGSSSFDSAFPRLATWIRYPENILFVCTHLDHIKGQTRLAQINVLAQEVHKLLHPDEKLILLGDFNAGPDSEERK